MITKLFLGRVLMMAALAVMTEGIMPAPGCPTGCVPNIHTYGEQSSQGSVLEQIRAWIHRLFV
jgi:hypothetical protein